MSGGTSNFTPTRRYGQVGYDWNQRQYPFPPSTSTFSFFGPDAHRGAPWQLPDEMVLTSPYIIASFPGQSLSLVQIPILGNPMARDVRPSPRQIIQRSPAGVMNQTNLLPVQEDNSRLNQDDQQAVLKKLKKEIYNPSPKKLAKRLTLYFRGEAKNVHNQIEQLKEDDAKRCAVCLEDFEAKEKVMLTPCNHMFHEDCIVPWVKIHAQCPVCRFSLSETNRENRASYNNNVANIAETSDES